jgi:hypothetical protein
MLSRCNPFSPRKDHMKNKIVAVGTLSLLTFLSFGKNIINANADLIPATYDYAYKQDFTDYWRVHNQVADAYDNPIYTRTGSVAAYNYEVSTSVELPFNVQMLFRLSDTPTWSSSGGGYRPGALSDSSIGSTSATNAVKVEFDFNNTTGKTYVLEIDMETAVTAEGIYTGTISSTFLYNRSSGTGFFTHVLTPYTNLNWKTTTTTAARQFNGWFLTEVDADYVGPSQESFDDGFNLGYEDGYSEGVNVGMSDIRMATLMGTIMNGIGGIFNIQILGNITLGTLALFPLLGVIVLFFKKVIQ